MATASFDKNAWLQRIGYDGTLEPTLGTLDRLIFAHSHAIAYESLEIMLGRTSRLDPESFQRKMISGGRGGYCLELNMLFREGLRSLGYSITSLQGRVVRGLAIDAPRPAIRVTVRHASGEAERRLLKEAAEFRLVLRDEFGLNISDDEVHQCIEVMERRGHRGAPHPFFA